MQQELEAPNRAVEKAQQATPDQPVMEAMVTNAALGGSFPKFRGDPNTDPPFDAFIQDYEMACDAFGLETSKKKPGFLSTRLQGHALEIFRRRQR